MRNQAAASDAIVGTHMNMLQVCLAWRGSGDRGRQAFWKKRPGSVQEHVGTVSCCGGANLTCSKDDRIRQSDREKRR